MALFLLAANNAQSVLSAGISSSATTLTVNTGAGALFPSPVAGTSYFKLTLVDAPTGTITEIVHVTARAGDVMTITRAQEGTTARAWSANDIVANMMTAGTLSLLAQINQSLQIANNLSEIAAAGPAAIAAALANLTLKTAALRDVGVGANQIPDMSSFTSGTNGNGAWTKVPGGGQWCRQNLSLAANGTTTWTFPAAFAAAPVVLITSVNGANQCWLNGIGASNCAIYNNGAALNVNVLAMW